MSDQPEEQNYEPPITPSSPVRLTVGLLTTIVLAFAYFLYARDDFYDSRNQIIFAAHEEHVAKDIQEIKIQLKGKANATQAEDRFTGKDFQTFKESNAKENQQFKESIEQRFRLIEEKNDAQHEAIKERIDHGRDDLRDAVQRIDNHYNMRNDK